MDGNASPILVLDDSGRFVVIVGFLRERLVWLAFGEVGAQDHVVLAGDHRRSGSCVLQVQNNPSRDGRGGLAFGGKGLSKGGQFFRGW